MMTRGSTGWAVAAWIVVCSACATSAMRARSLPEARATCDPSNASPTASVRIRVTDDTGSPLPGVAISLVAADDRARRGGLSQTAGAAGTDGWVSLDVPAGHHYLVSVGYVGFEPRSGILLVGRGCALELSVTLEVAVPKDTI
jgi:carboxypeptidase family protein